MKCKHNWVNYFWRSLLALCYVVLGFIDTGTGFHLPLILFLLAISAVIMSTVFVDQKMNYLEVDNSFIKGKTGLIKKQSLSSPLNRIDYCEYTSFLIWNSIRIATGSSLFVFKNVAHGREFVDFTNQYISQK